MAPTMQHLVGGLSQDWYSCKVAPTRGRGLARPTGRPTAGVRVQVAQTAWFW